MPTPPPIRRHCFLASAVAANRRGDQDKGTDISRPSASKTRKALSVQLTSTANGSTSMAKVLMPSLLEQNYTNRRISLNSLRRNPRHLAKATGRSQNLATLSADSI